MIKGDILECWIDGKLNLTFDNHYVQRQYVIPGLDRKNKEVIVKVINAEAVPMPMTLNIRNGELKLAFETEKFEMMNIKNCMLSACAGMLGLAAGCVSEPDGEIKVDFARKGADIPASMYGIFFEEINHSGDGGLYAELVQNRGFEDTSVPEGFRVEDNRLYPPAVCNHLTGNKPGKEMCYRWPAERIPGWQLEQVTGKGASLSLMQEKPLHHATPTSMLIRLPEEGNVVNVKNTGFWGMNIVQGDPYHLRFYIRQHTPFQGNLDVLLVGHDGAVLKKVAVELKAGSAWNEYKMELVPEASDTKAALVFQLAGKGELALDYVSLFPGHTFMNRPNGLRKDVAETLYALKPAFVRWPGGCIVEGISLSNRVKWKETLGDPMTRPGIYDTWGYRATMGFGYHEFLQFCEDIGADGMFVCNVGLGCQGRVGDACTDKELGFYIQDVLDAIEYALGDLTTTWGKKRVESGHPAPFPLKYVEIGNENWGPVYEKRYDIFYKAIKAKYPQLTLISTLGLGGNEKHEKVDMIDPHWYVAPDTFFDMDSIFDQQKRGDYKIYVGEYACNIGVKGGNMRGALGEAAFLTGVERNSDLVQMASYAPLLENVNDRVWPVNLIWVDSYRVMGRSSYYVQKMYADNRPSWNLGTTVSQPELPVTVQGKIGVGTWETQAEYKDFRIVLPDGKVEEADLSRIDREWKPISGTWSFGDGGYTQSESGPMKWAVWEKEWPENCTLEMKARKKGGSEGFLIFFGVNDQDGYVLNIGGWGNSATAFERMNNGGLSAMPDKVAQHIETDRWYDIRISMNRGELTFYLDGEQILQTKLTRMNRYAVAGYDEQKEEIVVKMVNAEDTPFDAVVKLDNVKIEPQGKVITLSALSGNDENSLDQPDKIIPRTQDYDRFEPEFNYRFEPWSFTIFRIKVKK